MAVILMVDDLAIHCGLSQWRVPRGGSRRAGMTSDPWRSRS